MNVVDVNDGKLNRRYMKTASLQQEPNETPRFVVIDHLCQNRD